MTKLRIDLQAKILEVEGEETFVKLVYQDYKDKFNLDYIPQPKPQSKDSEIKNQSNKDNNSKPEKSKNKTKESYAIVKDLDLSSNGEKQSLRDFYKEKLPNTAAALECNAVFVYFLQKIAGVTNITLAHIYSCYKYVGARIPNALRQSLLDTSHRKGWVDTSSFDNIIIATPGENYIEHDLPKVVAATTKK